MTSFRDRLREFLNPPLLFFAAPIALLVLVLEWLRLRRRLRERERPDA